MRKFAKKFLFVTPFCFAGLFCAAVLYILPVKNTFAATAATGDRPDKVQEIIDYGVFMQTGLYKIADNRKLSDDAKLTQMVDFVLAQMDLPKMAKKIMGPYLGRLSEADRQRYFGEFKPFMFANLKNNSADALLVPSKNVKMRKNPIHLSSQYYDVVYDVIGPSSNFPLVLSVFVSPNGELKIVNVSVDNIDIVSTQSMLFKTHLDQYGADAVFELMKEQM